MKDEIHSISGYFADDYLSWKKLHYFEARYGRRLQQCAGDSISVVATEIYVDREILSGDIFVI